MSPLACSLLALSALFNVATAIMPPPNCGRALTLGETWTKDTIEFTKYTAEGFLTIPDKCSRPGRKLVGEKVLACDPHGDGGPPDVYEVYENDNEFEQVDIKCRNRVGRNRGSCSDRIEVEVIQYCEMVTGPIYG